MFDAPFKKFPTHDELAAVDRDLKFRPCTNTRPELLDQTVDQPERYGTPVDIEQKAGEISIHADMLLHSSLANHSSRRRCGLTMRYCTPDVSGGFGWTKEGALVSGEDRFGHWANPPRPDVD